MEGRKEGKIDESLARISSSRTRYIAVSGQTASLSFSREKVDTRYNVSFLLPLLSTPPRGDLANNTCNRIVRPSFSSYGDAMEKNRNGLKAAVTFLLPVCSPSFTAALATLEKIT